MAMFAAMNDAARGYLQDHWQGRHSLAWSFWINLVLLRALIIGLEGLLRMPSRADGWHSEALAVVYFALAHVVVFGWQVVGVVRACDRHQADYGSMSVAWGVYLGLVLGAIFTLASVFTSFQVSFLKVDEGLMSVAWNREREARYALTLTGDGGGVALTGSLELGITKKLAALLREHSTVGRIALDSPGGNIYAGRGVARLILDRGLDTHVSGNCASACTTAFMAGASRSLGPGSRLGFHRYRVEAGYQVPFADPAGEQMTDRDFFTSRGIAPTFLDRVFAAPAEQLWYPETSELLAAGVVHRIGPEVR